MRAFTLWNPKARRVMRRNFGLNDSTSAFERLSSIAAKMLSRFLRTVVASLTNAGMRELPAQRNYHSRCPGASLGLARR